MIDPVGVGDDEVGARGGVVVEIDGSTLMAPSMRRQGVLSGAGVVAGASAVAIVDRVRSVVVDHDHVRHTVVVDVGELDVAFLVLIRTDRLGLLERAGVVRIVHERVRRSPRLGEKDDVRQVVLAIRRFLRGARRRGARVDLPREHIDDVVGIDLLRQEARVVEDAGAVGRLEGGVDARHQRLGRCRRVVVVVSTGCRPRWGLAGGSTPVGLRTSSGASVASGTSGLPQKIHR